MATTTTKIGIVNRGLQLLGLPAIASMQENSRGARAMSRCYDSVLLAELRANTWRFAIKRANLPADATHPIFGKKNYFPLPGDYLFLAPEETTGENVRKRDWEIEGQAIVSNDGAPLPVRYVSNNITEATFDVLFAEALSASLAMAACEELTNSNAKKVDAQNYHEEMMKRARRRNAIEGPPVKAPTCSWITARN